MCQTSHFLTWGPHHTIPTPSLARLIQAHTCVDAHVAVPGTARVCAHAAVTALALAAHHSAHTPPASNRAAHPSAIKTHQAAVDISVHTLVVRHCHNSPQLSQVFVVMKHFMVSWGDTCIPFWVHVTASKQLCHFSLSLSLSLSLSEQPHACGSEDLTRHSARMNARINIIYTFCRLPSRLDPTNAAIAAPPSTAAPVA